MRTNCAKLVDKAVSKSANKSWKQIVDKVKNNNIFTLSCEFCLFFKSFSHKVSTCNFKIFNLLGGKFYTFYTAPTNTTINIKEGF